MKTGWRCNNCDKLFDENPEACPECGSTVLEQTNLGELSPEELMGKKCDIEEKTEEKSLLDKLRFWK